MINPGYPIGIQSSTPHIRYDYTYDTEQMAAFFLRQAMSYRASGDRNKAKMCLLFARQWKPKPRKAP